MSRRGLVAQQDAMTDIESSLRAATKAITDFITQLRDVIDAQTSGWTEGTPSRQAQRAFEAKLSGGVASLTAAMDDVATVVADHRERCHDIEVENVAIVG